MLYLVATPIGNRADITLRAIEVLKSCDYILCEDTRHSLSLLQYYEIHKPLKSFHKFSEARKENAILQDLQSGKVVGLISDAGTPGIADPGQRLVEQCIEKNIPVTAIPGACAAIQALSCSGLKSDRFQFFGFLPKKAGELQKSLIEIFSYPGTTICYESPNRLKDVLKCIQQLNPQKPLVVARELTKKFEELRRGSAEELLEHFQKASIKGEIVLLISGSSGSVEETWEQLSPEEHLVQLQDLYGLSRQEAIKMVAKVRGTSKSSIYNQVQKKSS